MKEKVSDFWVNLVRAQLRFRYPILVILGIITIVFCIRIYQVLTIKTDFFELYPQKHPYIQLYKEFRKMFGSANVLSVIIERTDGQDIYNPETLGKVDQLTRGILMVKGCNPDQVTSIAHPKVKQIRISQGIAIVPLMHPRVPQSAQEAERFRKEVYSTEGVRGFYISLDDKSAVLYAGFWEEGLDLGNLFKDIQKLAASVEDEKHKVYAAGYPMLYSWVAHYLTEIWFILGINILAKFILLILYFRTARGLLIPALSMLVSIIWGLGFASFMGFNLDPLLFVVPLLLSSRALSHSCQCMERYQQEYAVTRDVQQAILRSYSALYPPATLAIVTDGLGILCVAIATIPLMQKLAFFSSFWIISIYVSVVLINPLVLSFLKGPKIRKADLEIHKDISPETAKKDAYGLLIRFLYNLSGPRAKWGVLAVIIVLILGGGYLTTTYLTVGDSSAGAAILYPDHPYNLARKKMNKDFVGASRFIVVLKGSEENAIKDKSTLALMEKLGVYMERNIDGVGGTMSLTNMVQSIYRMYHEGSPRWEMVPVVPAHLGQIFFMLSSNMAPGEMDQYVSMPDYRHSNVTAFLRDYNNASIKNAITKVKEFAKDLEADKESKVEVKLAGGILGILAAVNEEVEWSYWAILIAIFSSTFLLCLFAYRSLKAAIILIIPLLAAQVLSELLMLLLKIDLNINSLPVAAIGVGLGIDYGIYLLSRLKEETEDGGDFDLARFVALSTTGKVILFTAFNLSVGVSFWLLSAVKFQAEMGLLIGSLLWFNCISALVFIPALTGILKPNFVMGRKGKEVIA